MAFATSIHGHAVGNARIRSSSPDAIRIVSASAVPCAGTGSRSIRTRRGSFGADAGVPITIAAPRRRANVAGPSGRS